MELINLDHEIIISYSEAGESAEVYTSNKSLMNTLDEKSKTNTKIQCIHSGAQTALYRMPKEYLNIDPAKIHKITDAEKEKIINEIAEMKGEASCEN